MFSVIANPVGNANYLHEKMFFHLSGFIQFLHLPSTLSIKDHLQPDIIWMIDWYQQASDADDTAHCRCRNKN